MIVLDHNATTPVHPDVLAAMLPWLSGDGWGNPSSDHGPGRRARKAVDEARHEVAALVGAEPDEVAFVSGGTEADHLAILGVCAGRPGRVVSTTIEHPAVDAPLRRLEAAGWEVVRVAPGADGVVPAEALLAACPPRTHLASVMFANNETGALQPLRAVGPALRERGIRVHTDAAQAGGRVPVHLDRDGLDLVTLVGHKMGAPKGVGALVVRRGVALRALQEGGGQEGGRRAGTENVAAIVGFGVACRRARERIAAGDGGMAARRDRLAGALLARIPDLRISALGAPRLPNTLHVCVPGVEGREVLARCPELAASTGAACHAPGGPASAVLVAMGVPPDLARGALRLSLGEETTDDEVDRAAAWLVAAVREIRRG